MTRFSISSDAFRPALNAVLPFAPAATGDLPEDIEYVLMNTTPQGELLLTARSPGAQAFAVVPLEDFDGEMTDFAIHRDDARALLAQFRRSEQTLNITVQHQEYRIPPMRPDQPTQINRNTSIDGAEAGILFGSISASFVGVDARHIDLAALWLAASTYTGVSLSTPGGEFAIDSKRLGLLSKAERAYQGSTALALAGDETLVATVGPSFLALFPAWSEATAEAWRRTWEGKLHGAYAAAPEHQVYVDDRDPIPSL